MSAQGKADSLAAPMTARLDPALLRRPGRTAYRLSRALALSRIGGWHDYALIATPRTGMPAMPYGYSTRVVTDMADFEPAAEVAGVSRAVAQRRLDNGCACLVALRGDAPVGVTWVSIRPVHEDEIAALYDCGGRAAWDLGLHIAPEHRASRAFAALWAATGNWLDAHGARWSLSRIALYNDASLRAHARLDARLIGRVQALQIGRWQGLRATVAGTGAFHLGDIARSPKLALAAAIDALDAGS